MYSLLMKGVFVSLQRPSSLRVTCRPRTDIVRNERASYMSIVIYTYCNVIIDKTRVHIYI